MTNITCRGLINEGLPPLLCSEQGYRTHGASISSHHNFEGSVLDWESFDQEVRDFITAPNRHRQPNNTTPLFQRPGTGRSRFETETYLCGEEKGCEG
jgi:hypothetical protein